MFDRAARPVSTFLRRCALAGALIVALAACGESEPEPTPSTVFIGETAGGEAAIAVVVGADAGETVVYLCDGIDTSAWFFGTATGDAISAATGAGALAQATIAGGQVSGTVELPGEGTVAFTAAAATGVAGIFLVEHDGARAEGFSALGGTLAADLTPAADGFTLAGTIAPRDGATIPLTGTLRAFGEPTGVATWIVQADGDVKGVTDNTTGTGNCSVWAKIRQVMFGVHCTFF